MSETTKKIARAHGCGDNSCMFGSPGGMATNGGCRCLKNIVMHDEECREQARKIQRGVIALGKEIARLEAEIAVLNGTWCAQNIAEGRDRCGVCRTCLSEACKRKDRLILALRAIAGGSPMPVPVESGRAAYRTADAWCDEEVGKR